VIVLSHPEWWLDHVDELVDALTVAAQEPERNEPVQAGDDEVVVADPGWWLKHVDELTDALAAAAAIRERQERVQRTEQRQAIEPDHAWVDLEALRRAREQQPTPPHDPSRDHDRGIDR
jgi:hypothetical protein